LIRGSVPAIHTFIATLSVLILRRSLCDLLRMRVCVLGMKMRIPGTRPGMTQKL
jgi:hypothetical protein